MIPTTIITLVDGVRIVVPDSLEMITPYVLREQQDWFEDEIKFLRRLLQPGFNVIDIGANYGVYTLSMAQTVGPSGRVWAFEPASTTASLLAEGIAANGFEQVLLERAALSSARGTAQLSLNQNSELNAIVRDNLSTDGCETVPVITLDDCLESFGWRNIEFIKIDAEGEEANILKGGKRFFAELSPLVQYEVKAGAVLHLDLVQAFSSLGYESYRLVPGLDLLIPFDHEAQPDGYLLNLFCCKPDRVSQLVTQGFLLNAAALKTGMERFKARANHDAYNWRNTLTRLPYGTELADVWERTLAVDKSGRVEEALSLYVASQDASLPAAERYHALARSFMRFSFLCEQEPSYLRLASLARVAQDYGARSVAVSALEQQCKIILEHNQLDLSEPFLSPCARFDFVPPGEALGNWVLSALLEGFERLASFSSFYTGESARQRLNIIRELGFGSAEMQRRLLLLQQRFDLPRE